MFVRLLVSTRAVLASQLASKELAATPRGVVMISRLESSKF